jgi:hypothetical protein
MSYRPTLLLAVLALSLLLRPCPAQPTTAAAPVRIEVQNGPRTTVSPAFLGLSYEMSELLPHDGHYYFDASDTALVNLYRTLGIKNLRVGANAVDSPKFAVPGEKDIDSLFAFARAAGVKVIYSFRLKNGDPANSARLARYIADHDADALDSYAIGNEPEFFETIKPKGAGYPAFFALWKPHFDAILKAVPDAKIEGPSSTKGGFVLALAKDMAGDHHFTEATMHYYPFGNGRWAEQHIPGTLSRFLAAENEPRYEKMYADTAGKLAAAGGPAYRIDEMNSCFNGGGKGTSDAYASALWSLDWDHWWAGHRIAGINYHTGESVNGSGGFQASNYSSFFHRDGGDGFEVRPISYAHLAFTQGFVGDAIPLAISAPEGANLTVYAYSQGSEYRITLINRGSGPQPVELTMPGSGPATWERLDLKQATGDIAAHDGVTLGGAPIAPDGTWKGTWNKIPGATTGTVSIDLAPVSATILKFVPTP